MTVLSLICVSTRSLLQHYWTAPVANGVEAQLLEKQSITKKKNDEGEGEEGGKGASQKEVKRTMAVLYFMVLKGYSSQWSHCQAPRLYVQGGETNPCQTHLWAWRNGHRQTPGHQRCDASSAASDL